MEINTVLLVLDTLLLLFLIWMHTHADDYGFGSRKISKHLTERWEKQDAAIDRNTAAQNKLIRLINFIYEKYGGEAIPPRPVAEIDEFERPDRPEY